jgi:hypothetical protein
LYAPSGCRSEKLALLRITRSSQKSRIALLVAGHCKLNEVNPYDWLKDVLSRDIKETPINKIKDLLPHNWKNNKP